MFWGTICYWKEMYLCSNMISYRCPHCPVTPDGPWTSAGEPLRSHSATRRGKRQKPPMRQPPIRSKSQVPRSQLLTIMRTKPKVNLLWAWFTLPRSGHWLISSFAFSQSTMPLNLNSSELTEIWSLIALLKCQNLQKSNLCLHGQTILIFLFFEIDLVTRS